VIGKVQVIRAQFGFRHTKTEDDRWLNPALAGGSLLDIGVYPLAAARWITGEDPAEIQAQAILGSTGVDVAVNANLKYKSGILAQIASTLLADTQNELVILGTKGMIRIDKNFYMADEVLLKVNGEQSELFELPLRGSGFEYQIEEVMRCVRGGALQSPAHTHADVLSTMHTMDTIRNQIGVRYPFE
jgi:predicted dehydrogenase